MIEELRIRDLGVIADATLPLGPGLTVLTGETGAGKTMVVTALGLLMGRRSDPALVRRGAAAAFVEARLSVAPGGPVAARVADAGGELDGDELIVSRTVPADGRARAHAGGRAVPAAVLADVADELWTVHGQADQLLLRSPARQRALLDRFAVTLGGASPAVLDDYREAFRRWQAAARALEALERDRAGREREVEDLRAGLDLVAALAPEPGEDAALLREWERLAHADELRRAAETARTALGGGEADGGVDGGATTALARARSELEAARHHDEEVARLADRAGELAYLAADLVTDLAGYAAGVDADPERLAAVETRRHDLSRLLRRHGSLDEALAWAERARARLAELEEAGDEAAVAAAESAARAGLEAAAAALTAVRSGAAEAFGAAVTAELRELALPRARLVVDVTPADAPGPEGADEVDVRLAAHAGADPVPVARAASGGELSRVMLGVEVVVGAADPVATFVFDEVDAGVGGAAALGVGRRLARLGRTAQVLVVTHLAQVAAYADHHLVVEKSDEADAVVSTVTPVTDRERVAELARMLAGTADSEVALAHAAELLRAGGAERDSRAAAGGPAPAARTRRPRAARA
ncbi:MAG: DNA repair protein RecN [Kineosporiaceae bacterium]